MPPLSSSFGICATTTFTAPAASMTYVFAIGFTSKESPANAAAAVTSTAVSWTLT